jgi:hypothetical protein
MYSTGMPEFPDEGTVANGWPLQLVQKCCVSALAVVLVQS